MATFTGTSGDDSILGTGQGDDFHLEQGGEDLAQGAAGVDVFYMGASFDALDQLDGGGGADFLILDGDYSAGVALTATTMKNMERIQVAAGHSYVLTGLGDANIGGKMIVDATALAKGNGLTLDASAVTSALVMTGGGGADDLTGGSGADTLSGGGGHNVLAGGGGDDLLVLGDHAELIRGGDGDDRIDDDHALGFNARDKIDGGAGADTLVLTGAYGFTDPIVFNDKTIRNVETIILGGNGFNLVLADGNVAAGETLKVSAPSMQASFYFDGSAETDGSFELHASYRHFNSLTGGEGADHIYADIGFGVLSGGGGDDLIQGGDYADVLNGGSGADSLNGGRGMDKITGGLGADTIDGGANADTFVFNSVKESTAAAPDLLLGLGDSETVDLHAIDADKATDGDQAFHLVSAFSGQAGELVVAFDGLRHQTTISGDVDGDGTADLVIDVTGDAATFTHFVL